MTETRNPDTPTRPFRLADVEVWLETVDVLVVGYGGAGVCAAIEAAQAGAKTLVLERARSAEGYVSGTSIGDATFFGRLAGRTAATRGPS